MSIEYDLCIKYKDRILILNLWQNHNELDKIEGPEQEKTFAFQLQNGFEACACLFIYEAATIVLM